MELGIVELLTGLGALFLSVYYYLTWNFNFWNERNVNGPKPLPLFGNIKDVILGRTHVALQFQKFYDDYKNEPMVGIFIKGNPVLILKDPDLIKDVLIKDFHVFSDRGIYVSKDPIGQHLVNLEYERWRPLRNKLSPVFTSGKLKEMFYLINECAERFEKYIVKVVETDKPTECRELTAKFTTDAIGACAFGLNTNALDDENSAFRKCGRALFDTSLMNVVRQLLQNYFPQAYELLGPYKRNSEIDFFIKTMKETMDYRRQTDFRRNDFVDLMMDLQRQPDKISNIDFSDTFVIGQLLVFFAAGFETSSSAMSNTLYELALNPDVQGKLRKDIREELAKNDGKMTYESIKKMKYLDQVVKETLRKYPTGSVLQRKSTQEYTFNGTNIAIPKDFKVLIPVWAIHRDPERFPRPEKFIPERFSEENEKSRHPMNYLPFGDGPHNCIGLRFANYQTKIGIITMINKFKVDVCEKTCIPYRIEARGIIPIPVGGIHLKFFNADVQ